MKTINFKTIILFIFIINTLSCQAQLPLMTALSNIPQNAYVKDTNNILLPYAGIYTANYQGNEITLFIDKEENKFMDYGNRKFYRDVLNVKYIVKNASGTVLQDIKNNINTKIEIFSTMPRSMDNSIIFTYSGTNCGVGWGKIILKKINNTQISWEYLPNDIILDDSRCPPGTDITIYLPETKDLIFTKQ